AIGITCLSSYDPWQPVSGTFPYRTFCVLSRPPVLSGHPHPLRLTILQGGQSVRQNPKVVFSWMPSPSSLPSAGKLNSKYFLYKRHRQTHTLCNGWISFFPRQSICFNTIKCLAQVFLQNVYNFNSHVGCY